MSSLSRGEGFGFLDWFFLVGVSRFFCIFGKGKSIGTLWRVIHAIKLCVLAPSAYVSHHFRPAARGHAYRYCIMLALARLGWNLFCCTNRFRRGRNKQKKRRVWALEPTTSTRTLRATRPSLPPPLPLRHRLLEQGKLGRMEAAQMMLEVRPAAPPIREIQENISHP